MKKRISKASRIISNILFISCISLCLFSFETHAAKNSSNQTLLENQKQNTSDSKSKFMLHAIESAKEGIASNHGGPFGACIVKEGRVIAIAHNTVLKDHDPSCHAEMNAIRSASKNLNTHDLSGCEIYSTAEPCPMCLGAIHWANISKIYVGVSKDCAAKFGFRDDFFYQELQLAPNKRSIPCQIGILEDQCEEVFKKWKKLAGKLY